MSLKIDPNNPVLLNQLKESSGPVKVGISDSLDAIAEKRALQNVTLLQWAEILSNSCNVYRLGEQYLAKSFDSVEYKLCSEDTARDILLRNIDVLLYYHYFPRSSDEESRRVEDIKAFCSKRIASMVKKVRFREEGEDGIYLAPLPASCIAFNNGVYDFATSSWLFKYEKVKIDDSKYLITYPNKYRIMWFINQDYAPHLFENIPLSSLSFEEFVQYMKVEDEEKTSDPKKKSMFFELLYNMSYDEEAKFNLHKCLHLAEIFGYLLYAPFVQQFVFFVGDGSNGKDSIFDAFFRDLIVPIPAGNNIMDLENDKFVLGSLVGVGQNICSETETSTITRSAILKQLTGSQFQTIEEKGVDKYTGYMNCKFVFAANNREQLKFKDTSTGFRRRINMYECFYQWDKWKNFLKLYPGTYDTTYLRSEELRQNDGFEEFLLTAMYGIKSATNNFTAPFNFTENDYEFKEYADLDEDLIKKIKNISIQDVRLFFDVRSNEDPEYGLTIFYSTDGQPLYKDTGRSGYMEGRKKDSYINIISKSLFYRDLTTEQMNEGEIPMDHWFFEGNEFFIRMDFFYDVIRPGMTRTKFTVDLKKNFPNCVTRRIQNNVNYIKCNFDTNGYLILENK